jgi:hypothetical protein
MRLALDISNRRISIHGKKGRPKGDRHDSKKTVSQEQTDMQSHL